MILFLALLIVTYCCIGLYVDQRHDQSLFEIHLGLLAIGIFAIGSWIIEGNTSAVEDNAIMITCVLFASGVGYIFASRR